MKKSMVLVGVGLVCFLIFTGCGNSHDLAPGSLDNQGIDIKNKEIADVTI